MEKEMQNIYFTQLSGTEIKQLFRNELELFFTEQNFEKMLDKLFENYLRSNEDKIGGIELAIELTKLAKPTIFGLTSSRKIPHSKLGKKLYFSRQELLEWVANGKRETES